MKKGRIDLVDNLLSSSEISYLNNCISNFIPYRQPGEGLNYYFNTFIDINKLSTFTENVKEYSRSIGNEYLLEAEGSFINRINTTSNLSDGYHDDHSKLSSVTLLNDDYEGGQINYIDSKGEEANIRCKKYSTLIFNGNETLHRVLPVTQGIRWSLATFYLIKTKNTKTLL